MPAAGLRSRSRKNSASADSNNMAASPRWVAGNTAVFKSPGSLSFLSGSSRRTSVHLRRLHGLDSTQDFQGGFSLPDAPSPEGVVTRSRRSSVYFNIHQSTRTKPGLAPKLPKTRGRGRPKAKTAPPSKVPQQLKEDALTQKKEKQHVPQPSAAFQKRSLGKRTRSKEPSKAEKTVTKKMKVEQKGSPAVSQETPRNGIRGGQARKSRNHIEPSGDDTREFSQVDDFKVKEKKTDNQVKMAVPSFTLASGISPKAKTPPKQFRQAAKKEFSPFVKLRSPSGKTPKACKSLLALSSTPLSAGKATRRSKTPVASKLREGVESPALKSDFKVKEKKTDNQVKVAVPSFTLASGISPKAFYKTPPKQFRQAAAASGKKAFSPFTKLQSPSGKTPKACKSLLALSSTPLSAGKATGRSKTPVASKLREGVESPALKSTRTPRRILTPSTSTSTPIIKVFKRMTPRTATPHETGPKSVIKFMKTPMVAPLTPDQSPTLLSPVENLTVAGGDQMENLSEEVDQSQFLTQSATNSHDVSLNSSANDSANTSAYPSSFRFGCQLM